MKKIILLITLLMIILTGGCTLEKKQVIIDDDYPITQNKEIKVNIQIDARTFYEEGTFTPIVDGDLSKEVQYHWILKGDIENENIHGFVSENGPCLEVINSGEAVKFASYAEVSYTEDAYSEIKVILQIEEKGSNRIIATDEATIINRQGMYFVKTSKEEEFQAEILKSEKAKVYGEIFDIIWESDKGLNTGIEYVNIDTSTFEEFTEEDKEQLLNYISKKYNVTTIDKTFKELEAEGYIKESSFLGGISFYVDKYTKNTENEISFEGAKWASGIGAIGFSAKAEKSNGEWKIKKCYMTWIS